MLSLRKILKEIQTKENLTNEDVSDIKAYVFTLIFGLVIFIIMYYQAVQYGPNSEDYKSLHEVYLCFALIGIIYSFILILTVSAHLGTLVKNILDFIKILFSRESYISAKQLKEDMAFIALPLFIGFIFLIDFSVINKDKLYGGLIVTPIVIIIIKVVSIFKRKR